ncbi:MAG: hypothetical protein JW861_12465 [Bacteroidales bacterium]|nr:hypothetical protein [Bacteroidales bacterium]
MKRALFFSVLAAMILMAGSISAQSTCISDVSHTADASAVLDVYSTARGMLLPRLTTTQRTGITSPATGLVVYDTDINSFFFYDGSSWVQVSSGQLWSRTGTDTYLSNMSDNLVIGTNSSAPGYKFYVFGAASQMSRFDGQVEFWDLAGGKMNADVNNDGLNNGVISVYNAASNARIRLRSGGNSFFAGGNVCIGGTNPLNLLHLIDPNGTASPQLQVDNPTGAGNTSIGYGFGGLTFAEGIDGATGNYKLCNTPGLAPSFQGDGSTMMRAFRSGIVDLNNQSRVRAWQQQNPMLPMGMGQPIPFNIWTPVDYEMISYDQQGEFTTALTPPYSPGGGPAAAFFRATEEGYYQVNARTDFWLYDTFYHEEINFPLYPGYVSIAIVVTDQQGVTTMYAQGNKLQGADNAPMGNWSKLENNLAPNVSDVVYLKKNETIEIWVWQSLWNNPIPLRVGPNMDPGVMVPPPSQTYVSVHKVS